MAQGKSTLEEYYGTAKKLASDIVAKIRLDPENARHEIAVIRYAENITKDCFIDGLREPYSSSTRNYQPKNLREAYQVALLQANADKRCKATYRHLLV